MAEVIIYSTAYCPYCVKAKELLQQKHTSFTDIRIDLQPELRDEMITKSGRRTVPQIFINGQHIGGCDDLYALDAQGELDPLLRG
ncbi:glutaredoxin 3 [Legionella anisa]|uniref:Glutaredoxin n=1 Tax=Legionella anisa TaxID=28082 RepID=A0AAX0WVW0_9GAMM|nr:glutaredoxin 3 [Legionella anisa]AWN73313.1 glutaredoxin 3 [Legionella anisa]KTC69874.1 glutaredoxin Grx [Legionella anisa]MBN5937347.1 glutaredoxin 3 [Legionella anisa]MCW8423023.1 glutaredoxin 3 [Legionella anisa]MCW8447834.1 glutaredoxin 3 [Legionella anisa]